MLKSQKILVAAVARIQEDKVLELTRQCLVNGMDPFVLLEEVRAGMEKVGELYNKGIYFLADLIMAAEIFKQVQGMVEGYTRAFIEPDHGVDVVFGTVENDIHDIGKNIAISVMRSEGISVLDLGVNVKPSKFMEELRETQACVLCLSGLITLSYESMRRTVLLLEAEFLRTKTTVIVGGLVNQDICHYANSDFWVRDARAGSQLCRNIIAAKSQQKRIIS